MLETIYHSQNFKALNFTFHILNNSTFPLQGHLQINDALTKTPRYLLDLRCCIFHDRINIEMKDSNLGTGYNSKSSQIGPCPFNLDYCILSPLHFLDSSLEIG